MRYLRENECTTLEGLTKIFELWNYFEINSNHIFVQLLKLLSYKIEELKADVINKHMDKLVKIINGLSESQAQDITSLIDHIIKTSPDVAEKLKYIIIETVCDTYVKPRSYMTNDDELMKLLRNATNSVIEKCGTKIECNYMGTIREVVKEKNRIYLKHVPRTYIDDYAAD